MKLQGFFLDVQYETGIKAAILFSLQTDIYTAFWSGVSRLLEEARVHVLYEHAVIENRTIVGAVAVLVAFCKGQQPALSCYAL